MMRIPSLSGRQNMIVAAAVRAVADKAAEDKLAHAIAGRAGRQPDDERILFAIVDGLEDFRLTAPGFILRRVRRVLGGRGVARPLPAPKVSADADDGAGDFSLDVPSLGAACNADAT